MGKSKKKKQSSIGICPHCGEPSELIIPEKIAEKNPNDIYTYLSFICPNGHQFSNAVPKRN